MVGGCWPIALINFKNLASSNQEVNCEIRQKMYKHVLPERKAEMDGMSWWQHGQGGKK